jgi:branched-chain amino acid aminotransferase group I
MMEEIVYLNGELVPRSKAQISAFDYGFLYGYGLFETMRAYSGRIFRLEQHLDRLRCSAKVLGLDVESIDCDLEKALYDTLRANELADARVRLTVSGGEGDATPDLTGSSSPTVLIVATNYVALSPRKELTVAVSSIRRNSHSPISWLKSLNYLDNLLARRIARSAGADDALLLNEEGFVAEASTCNVFLVSRGTLITPDEESGILPGVTRRAVMELAVKLGVKVTEAKVTLEELLKAEEAFLTNSLIELVPLVMVDGRSIGSGSAGRITKKFMRAYKELLQAETREQKST